MPHSLSSCLVVLLPRLYFHPPSKTLRGDEVFLQLLLGRIVGIRIDGARRGRFLIKRLERPALGAGDAVRIVLFGERAQLKVVDRLLQGEEVQGSGVE